MTPLDGQKEISLPEVIMQNEIPDSWDQIPSPEEVANTPGFEDCSHLFPEKDPAWETLLLIGRDCMAVQWQEQFFDDKKGNTSQMLAKTPLGWTLIGSPTFLTANRRYHRNKRRNKRRNGNWNSRRRSLQQHVAYIRSSPVFMTTDHTCDGNAPEETSPEEESENSPQENDELDELEAMSRDEEEFMRKTVPFIRQRDDGMIEIPLPFKVERPSFPYNRGKALQRTKTTLENLKRQNPIVFQSSLDKFQKNLETSTPRFIPVPQKLREPQHGRAYWISLFAVWQKEKARIVFDAKAPTDGVCLNDKLYQGPDRNNSLRGILIHFRGHPFAVSDDIENMFHQIAVPE